jgi:hypothetical protein
MDKKCNKCWERKEYDNFPKGKKYADWYRNWCKACCKQYYENNKERILARCKEYAIENIDILSKRRKEYYEKHKEWWNDHRDRDAYLLYMKEYNKKYNDTHKEEKKIKSREYFLENKEKIYTRYNEYRNTENWRLRKKVYKHRRRTQMIQTDDWTVTKESLQKIVASQNYKCNICNIALDFSKKSFVHLDHIIPLIKWWKHTISNLQFLCISCNCSKWWN